MSENDVGTMFLAIPIVAILACVAVTWIKAKHGLIETSAQLTKKIEAELATRDARIAEQAERIKVLERIVTDRPTELNREIDRLRA